MREEKHETPPLPPQQPEVGVGDKPGGHGDREIETALRGLKPTFTPPDRLAERIAKDPTIKCWKQNLKTLVSQPLPTPKAREAAWKKVRQALAEFLPLHFARPHQQLKIMELETLIRQREIQIQEQIQKNDIERLRRRAGLRYIKGPRYRSPNLPAP